MNNTTRSYPRTMEQAFGPGHRGGLYVEHEPMHKSDRIVVRASAAVFVIFLAILIIWS